MKPFSEIPLPESSSNEELEAKSRKKFEALFDEQRFILKPEIIDNGVDYRIELKLKNKKLVIKGEFSSSSDDERFINYRYGEKVQNM